jgi:hypothetical protein
MKHQRECWKEEDAVWGKNIEVGGKPRSVPAAGASERRQYLIRLFNLTATVPIPSHPVDYPS